MTDAKPTLLILSFSPIYRDARVLKQVRLFSQNFAVTTCSYGPAPDGVVGHIQIPETESYLALNGRLITVHMYRRAYWSVPAVKWAWEHLRGKQFDVILADDFDAVPVAVRLRPRYGVHADLHEYSPSQFEDNAAWARRIKPFREWVCRKYVTQASSWTTVCDGLADKYDEMFGFRASVVPNATPYAALSPGEVSRPLRLVHHGGVNPARGIPWMVEAVMASDADIIFDLYLQDPAGRESAKLTELSAADPRISILPAVPYDELIPLLATYDVGLSTIKPATFNLRHALPNKLFDYVQARLGIITGPSPEMARVVRDYHLGIVTEDFSAAALTAAVDSLEPAQVSEWKHNADQVACELSAEKQNDGWLRPIGALVSQRAAE